MIILRVDIKDIKNWYIIDNKVYLTNSYDEYETVTIGR